MARYEILYTSADVHRAIKFILGNPNRNEQRMALVAYIGSDGDTYLPHPKGLQIVCCLQPGATDANCVGRLIKAGAVVRKSRRLHMKVYWSERKGAVVCSANASTNALGRNATKEAGVFVPAEVIDIKRLLGTVRPQSLAKSDLPDLARRSDQIAARTLPNRVRREKERTYTEWYDSSPRDWKFAWYEVEVDKPSATLDQAVQSESTRRQASEVITGRKGDYAEGDWALQFRLPHGTEVGWCYVDFVKRLPSNDPFYHPPFAYGGVQIHPNRNYPAPPFKIDARFKAALKQSVRSVGPRTIISGSVQPTKAFLRLLLQRYKPK